MRALTPRQRFVLTRLNVPGARYVSAAWCSSEAVDGFKAYVVLKQLQDRGLVERRVAPLFSGDSLKVIKGWRITDAGRSCVPAPSDSEERAA